MTKDEYQDFVLRYKGCGACFPMYHTLSRFEKMWFTAIQKDVAELERKLKVETELSQRLGVAYREYEQLTKEQDEHLAELEAQIEKMRNCANCKNYNSIEGFCILGSCYGYNCNLEKWEIKEK